MKNLQPKGTLNTDGRADDHFDQVLLGSLNLLNFLILKGKKAGGSPVLSKETLNTNLNRFQLYFGNVGTCLKWVM